MSAAGRAETAPPVLPLWQRLWLAEWLRRQEERGQRRDDRALVAALRPLRLGDQEAILRRAEGLLGADEQASVARARHGWPLLLALTAGLAIVAGVASAAAALAGPQPVNLAWSVAVLLGLPTLSLMLWALACGRRGGRAGLSRWGGLLGWSLPAAQRQDGLQALLGVLRRPGLAFWSFSLVSHLLWAVLLLAALLGLALLLSLRQYDFVWETTLLPVALLSRALAWLAALPGWLGGVAVDPAPLLAGGTDSPELRRAWALWLLQLVAALGLLPRLLLAALAGLLWRRRLARVGLDLAAPYYLAVLRRLQPDSEQVAKADAEGRVPNFSLAGERPGGRGRWLLGLELADQEPWPPEGWSAPAGPLLDSREQRRAALQTLQAQPPARLLVAVDARRSPDRSCLATLADLAACGGPLAVWLLHAELAGERSLLWREQLLQAGLPAARIIDRLAAAAAWWQEGE